MNRFFKRLLLWGLRHDVAEHALDFGRRALRKVPVLISVAALGAALFDAGFEEAANTQYGIHVVFLCAYGVGFLSILARYWIRGERPRLKVWPIDLLICMMFAYLLSLELEVARGLQDMAELIPLKPLMYLGVLLVFIREFSALRLELKRQYLNPAQLFIVSFALIVTLGALLLKLPKATAGGISLVDAFFTSASAVCVTGLASLDTGTDFTLTGQVIILALIQAGGLGIMTFASYFSYFFRGGASFENQLVLSDMVSADRLGEVFLLLRKIILVTLGIEALGAAFIYAALSPAYLASSGSNPAFFAVFHAVSAFCNAGFSTLSESLYDAHFRFNYPLQLILALLFTLGGLGFPIVFNLARYIRYQGRWQWRRLRGGKGAAYSPWVVNINSRIVLATTAGLALGGSLLFYLFEQQGTLAEHRGAGKILVAFFSAMTPRTAGFNVVQTDALGLPAIMLMFFLMWVGASPASTGGGIKTSTFAIATLNIISLAKGKDRIEIYRREIAHISTRRAFAIISLSLVAISTALLGMVLTDPNLPLLKLAFECVSAYSTVGLSMGITSEISAAGKIMLIALMFVGRVGALTLLIALMRKVEHLSYRYPSEEILIN